MVTHDGGGTWVLQTAGARPWFEDVDVVDTLDGPRAWAVGRRLAIVALKQTPETTPPATTDNAPATWSRKPVTVAFAATDAGSGVARVTSRIDDDSWQRGVTHIVSAPVDHINDGVHTITYFGEDHAGNREAAQTRARSASTRAGRSARRRTPPACGATAASRSSTASTTSGPTPARRR